MERLGRAFQTVLDSSTPERVEIVVFETWNTLDSTRSPNYSSVTINIRESGNNGEWSRPPTNTFSLPRLARRPQIPSADRGRDYNARHKYHKAMS